MWLFQCSLWCFGTAIAASELISMNQEQQCSSRHDGKGDHNVLPKSFCWSVQQFCDKITSENLNKDKFCLLLFSLINFCKLCRDNNPHQILFQVEIKCSGGPLLLINKHLYIEILGVCLFVCLFVLNFVYLDVTTP